MYTIGKTLGNFEITNQLGKGGMGEVYQAIDRKLGRDVAIKVLPEEFAKDTDRVARFQREAKLLASLNHPNIAAIYGLEESGGTNFLVLELVEGQTLADRIKAGSIPVEESLKLALQIAEALEAAHEKGVIHRDLKPANIKVTPEGKVKVLDFGLAKAFAGEQAELNLSNSPTLSNAATQQGVILGTAAYMSPEQARGKVVDKRADIWAFGCVLYEMLTGQQTWSGATVTDIIAAALAKDPDFTKLPSSLHPRIRELLSRCLQKDPAERSRDVGDVRIEIKKILADPGGVLVQPVAGAEPRARMRNILQWIAALVLMAVIAGVAVWKLKPPEQKNVIRFDCELPEGQQFYDLASYMLAVSPDGKQFVYCTTKGLYLRSMNELSAKFIPGTEGNNVIPFFSPDGKWIGYHSQADGKLKKIPISGGAPVALCSVDSPASASWNTDNTIVYSQYTGAAIMRISANGGTPETLVKTKSESMVDAQILPDDKTVLFASLGNAPKIIVQSIKSGERKELFPGTGARYLPTGHIIYAGENSLFAVPFDLDRLEVTGGPVPIVEGVFRTKGPALYEVSDSGTLAYIPGTTTNAFRTGRTLVWVDKKGREESLPAPPNAYNQLRISPDGTRIALELGAGDNNDIWIWHLIRKTLTRLTFDQGDDGDPVWTHDGMRILFSSDREGNHNVYWKAADGTGEDEKLNTKRGALIFPYSLSSDGKTVVLNYYNKALDIGLLSIEGNHEYGTLLGEKHSEGQPQISHNGKWIAYTSNESGRNEIYVRPFPEVDKGKWQISTGGGDSPLWSRDDRELFYRSGDAFVSVPVRSDPVFSPGTAQILFRGTYVNEGASATWDISSDGKWFLMIKESAAAITTSPGPRKINIVLNWFEELKARAPVK